MQQQEKDKVNAGGDWEQIKTLRWAFVTIIVNSQKIYELYHVYCVYKKG